MKVSQTGESKMRYSRTGCAGIPAIMAMAAIAWPGKLVGQTKVYHACYVPSSGTVYRIKEADLPQQCGSSTKKGVTLQHVEFSWSDGQGGTGGAGDHGGLTGLTDDDHTQYALADGVRNATNGFAITGTWGTGTIPASGIGTRLMWYPAKAAFRVGYIGSDQWDDAWVGLHSIGLGSNAVAKGDFSSALGVGARAIGHGSAALMGLATGDEAIALGPGSKATAKSAVSIGNAAEASGNSSYAWGTFTQASGDHSMAIGQHADTNGKSGSFVWGDGTQGFSSVKAVTNNQFVVRATRFWFGNNNNVTASIGKFIETSTGAFLSTGGAWVNSSDVNRKANFSPVDGEETLTKLVTLPIQTWNYRDEEASVRHVGPTAQDFRAAFGLGASETSIATVDADGVSLAAIQALARRTTELYRDNESLHRANDELRAVVRALAQRIDEMLQSNSGEDRR
jgi:hypothetical protein